MWAASNPPQTIMRVPAQTALWLVRAVGALTALVVAQVLVVGLYRAPVFTN